MVARKEWRVDVQDPAYFHVMHQKDGLSDRLSHDQIDELHQLAKPVGEKWQPGKDSTHIIRKAFTPIAVAEVKYGNEPLKGEELVAAIKENLLEAARRMGVQLQAAEELQPQEIPAHSRRNVTSRQPSYALSEASGSLSHSGSLSR